MYFGGNDVDRVELMQDLEWLRKNPGAKFKDGQYQAALEDLLKREKKAKLYSGIGEDSRNYIQKYKTEPEDLNILKHLEGNADDLQKQVKGLINQGPTDENIEKLLKLEKTAEAHLGALDMSRATDFGEDAAKRLKAEKLDDLKQLAGRKSVNPVSPHVKADLATPQMISKHDFTQIHKIEPAPSARLKKFLKMLGIISVGDTLLRQGPAEAAWEMWGVDADKLNEGEDAEIERLHKAFARGAKGKKEVYAR